MPSIERHEPNSIAFIDLATTDLPGALEYYSDAMGWTDFPVPETDYHMLLNGDAPVAGAMAISNEMAGMPPVWSVYVGVEDIDAAITRSDELGGQTMQQPFEIPDGGRIAVVLSPDGAALCLYEGVLDSGFRQIDEVGAPCWFDSRTRDADAAEEYYRQMFGWDAEVMADAAPMDYRVLSMHGRPIAGIMAMDASFPAEVPPHWAVSFSVADADEVVAKTTKAGGTVTMPPMDTPFGRSAGLIDPWGAAFMVIDRSSGMQ